MTSNILKVVLRWLVLLLLGLAVVLGFSRVVPYCMDEFLQYNEIIYRYYPNNRLNTFDERPGLYDLNVLGSGLVLPLRCYDYMGVVPALYYFPLFAIWKDPASARFTGIVFLFLQSLLLARIVRFKSEYLFLGLVCFFPYLFQHLVETGLVGLQIVCLLGIYLLLGRWFGTPTWRRAIGIASLVFLGVWTKLSFLWYGPALLWVAGGFAWQSRGRWLARERRRDAALQAAVGAAVLLALLSVLFASTGPADPGRYPYREQVFGSPYGARHGVSELLDSVHLRSLPVFDRLWNPWRAAERVFDPPADLPWALVYSACLYAAGPLLWLVLARNGWTQPRRLILRALWVYVAFWLTLAMVFLNKEAWAMHHTLLAYPFLVLSLLISLEAVREGGFSHGRAGYYRRVVAVAVSAFVALNSYYYVLLPRQKVDPENDASRIRLNARLADAGLARGYFYVVLDWGVYFYQALYGHRDQSVLYVSPLTPARARELRKLQARTGRKLLFLYNPRLPGHDPGAVDRYFRVIPCDLLGTGAPAPIPGAC